MNLYISGIILFSLLFSAAAKPGETYVLTGREKSVFGIFQADMKAYPDLYEDEDINAYYAEFKTLNSLEGRKLKRGEEIIFPHTEKSKELQQAEKAKAVEESDATERTMKAARKEARRARNRATAGEVPSTPSENQVTLFGSDKRSYVTVPDEESEIALAEARRENARHEAIYHFQHTVLPQWMYDHNLSFVEPGEKSMIETLVAKAQAIVDEPFAKALVLHDYPDKGIYILEFESPTKVTDYFFFAIKKKAGGQLHLYALEKGISFFGTGNPSVLFEWNPGGDFSELGGMKYTDLASFLKELEAARPGSSRNE